MAKERTITFIVTKDCQLVCKYCYLVGKNPNEKMTLDVAKKAVDKILENSYFFNEERVVWDFIGGEPLLEIDLITNIVDYIEMRLEALSHHWKNNYGIRITTNGLLYKSQKVQNFISKYQNILNLSISIDGTKRKQDLNRVFPNGKGSYKKYVLSTNKSDVREIVDWFKMQFNTTPNFSPLHVPTEDAKDGNRILSMLKTFEIPKDIELVPSLITQNPVFNRILVFTTRLLNNSVSKESELLVDESIENSTLPTGTCIPFSKRLFVSYNGKIHPCEKVNRDSPLGYIDNSGCVHIDCNEVANGFMKRIAEVSSICKKCYMQFCCTKCSFCYSNGKCDEFTSKSKFAKLLSDAVSYIESHPDILEVLEENIIIK